MSATTLAPAPRPTPLAVRPRHTDARTGPAQPATQTATQPAATTNGRPQRTGRPAPTAMPARRAPRAFTPPPHVPAKLPVTVVLALDPTDAAAIIAACTAAGTDPALLTYLQAKYDRAVTPAATTR